MTKKTPTMIQIEPVECGAVALGIIFGYWGKFLPMEELRQACGISRNGSVAINLLKVARLYGFEARGFRYSLEELGEISHPFIVYWDQNHFLVVESITKNHVKINDPARGHLKIGLEEFVKHYSEIALVIKPGEGFKPEGGQKSVLEMLKPYFAGYGQAFFYLICLYFFLLVPALAVPTLGGFFVDEILVKHSITSPFFVIIALGTAFSLTLGIKILEGWILMRFSGALSIRLSSHFFWHLLRLPAHFFFQRHGGEVVSRLHLNDSIAAISRNLLRVSIQLVQTIVLAILLFLYDIRIALLGIFFAMGNLVVMWLFHQGQKDLDSSFRQKKALREAYSIGGIQHIETIKEIGAEEDFFFHWAGFFSQKINLKQQIGIRKIFLNILPFFYQLLVLAIIFFIGGAYLQEGKMTAGRLFSLQIIMILFLFPFTQFVSFSSLFRTLRSQTNRVQDALANPPYSKAHLMEAPSGEIKVDNITFGYSQVDRPLFANFTFHLAPGQSIAISGPTGSGKTTLTRLLAGVFSPWSGTIHISHSLAVVDEQIFLFSGSVRENLLFWDMTLSEEQIVRGAEDACIHSAILGRENGYDGKVLEGGKNFSASQCARLEIARALAQDPNCLVLDGITDILDPFLEEQILKNVKQRGCSCVLMTNRPNAIRLCDVHLILEQVPNHG
jgi:ABC-type bacteriocin/lantibiotic exporter with double-glycine peptidase domain